MHSKSQFAQVLASLLLTAGLCLAAPAASIGGQVTDPDGEPVAGATIHLLRTRDVELAKTRTANDGRFGFAMVDPGSYRLVAENSDFVAVDQIIDVMDGSDVSMRLQFTKVAPHSDTVTATADVKDASIQNPDPAQRVLIREEILDANPGRPGAPVSLPGLPIETAAGGIKAPQYFAPGVAGDHGEPIAMFIQVGSFPIPNNLSANAHGNGYADPNILVPAVIEAVQTDGGAFNVREGNHSVNASATYSIRPSLQPFATLTGDYRDADLSAGWRWFAVEAAYGNGFLDTLEHRRQYKINAVKSWTLGSHSLTALLLGYYGQSRIPGLVPIDVANLHDTIDRRQHDQTHTGEIAVNDIWQLAPGSEIQLSSFFRTYNLALYSDFGDGLIRQSEFRTVAGGNASYIRRANRHLTFMAGMDYFREAPRRDDLDRYNPFQKVTANNITLNFLSPFVAVDGDIASWLHYNLGWRRDHVEFQATDLLSPAKTFQRWQAINSPKATLSFVPPEYIGLPAVSLSWGQSFFTNDPRMGAGTLVGQAHSYQLVGSKTVAHTNFRVTLGHVTQSASLAKVDPDTGLAYDEGPGRNRYVTASARHTFRFGFLQGSISKADARNLLEGAPVPEAPRLIVDVLGTLNRLPFGLHARAEFEEVGRKPLGDGFSSVPVREFRAAVVRDFREGKIRAGIHFQIARGYTGQTTETLALPGESDEFERVVGVYLPSYATATVSYCFGRR